jgi:hypothetical protein
MDRVAKGKEPVMTTLFAFALAFVGLAVLWIGGA